MPFFGRDPAVLFEYRAGMDLALLGATFSRPDATTCAMQMDKHGIWRQVPANVLRDRHSTALGAAPRALIEPNRVNSCLQSRNLSLTWTGAATATLTGIGIDGVANSCTVLTDDDPAAFESRGQNIVIANDGATHIIQFWIGKDNDETRFPQLGGGLSGGTAVGVRASLNTKTGAFFEANKVGGTAAVATVRDGGLWWIVTVTLKNNTTGNTILNIVAYPAARTVINGADNVAAVGSIVVGHAQVELATFVGTSPIFTTTAAVSRAGDNFVCPVSFNPHELSMYSDGIDVGAGRQPDGQFAITSMAVLGRNSGGDFDLSNRLNANGVDRRAQTRVGNAGGSPTQTIGDITSGTLNYGDRMEIVSRMYQNGTLDAQQSINGGAAVTGAISTGVIPIEAAWGLNVIEIGHFGSTIGGWAIASVKVVSGLHALEEMRAFTIAGRAQGARPRLTTPPRFPGSLQSWGQSGKGQMRAVKAMGRTWQEVYPTLDASNPNVRALLQQINKALREGTVWDVQHPYWQKRKGVGGGVPQVNGSNQTGSVLLVDGAPLLQFNWLRAGDIIKVPGCPVIFDVTEDVITNAVGQASIPIHPPIFVGQSPADNALITIDPESIYFKAVLVETPDFPLMDVTEHLDPGLTLTWREQPQ